MNRKNVVKNYYMSASEVYAPEDLSDDADDTVTLNATVCNDVYKLWPKDSLKWFCKKTNSFSYTKEPIILVNKIFKKIPCTVETKKFETLSDIENFVKNNRGLLIYQISELELDDVGMYFVRYFNSTVSNEPICLNWFTYLYNYLFA